MSDKFLKGAVEEFAASCSDIEENLNFLDVASSIRPRLGRMANWTTLSTEERQLLQKFLSMRCDGGTAYQGLLVRLVASFEAFLRRLIRDAVNRINRKGYSLDKIPEHLLNRNRHCAGRVMAMIYDPPSYQQIDFEKLSREIGTCVKSSERVRLSGDAIAWITAGSSVEMIERMFEQIGAKVQWDLLGKDSKVKAFLDQARTRDASKETLSWLKEMKERRNGFAHTGVGGVEVTATEIVDAIDFLGSLARLLADQLESEIASAYL